MYKVMILSSPMKEAPEREPRFLLFGYSSGNGIAVLLKDGTVSVRKIRIIIARSI